MSQLRDILQPVRTYAEDSVRMRYQEKTSEDIEEVICAAVTVIFKVCKPLRLLYLFVFTGCVYKCSVNPITSPNPVYSHSNTRQYCGL
jgi:hypothetical protein